MLSRDYYKEWTAIGELIANGGSIGRSDLYAIYDTLDIGHIKPDYLPGELTVSGSDVDRKKAIFALAQKLWGLTPDDWLMLERYRLREVREISGSTETEGKDDAISAEIMVRIFAAAKIVTEDNHDREISDEAVRALNIFLAEACANGRTRMTMVDGRSVYSVLKENGLMIGSSGGKYLPNPKKALPFLLFLLNKESVNPEAYLK